MYRVLVRAKKDADAVKAALRVFYEGWGIEVATAGGARGYEDFRDALSKAVDPARFNIVLLGREDAGKMQLEEEMPLNVAFSLVPRERVRNARLTTIRDAIERGRAKIRNTVRWRGAYVLGRCEGADLGVEPHPAYDVFLLLGERAVGLVSEHIGARLEGPLLLVRKMGGEHDVYAGPSLVGRLRIPDSGRVSGERLGEQAEGTSLERLLAENERVLETLERVSASLLERVGREFDTVVVPWSGGRDSTAALLLARKALGSKVKAVYVDMGLEFRGSREHVIEVSERLGVELHVARVDLGRYVRSVGLPSHDNRWCTRLKIEALYSKVREVAEGRTLIVVGDRDAESELRSKRGPVREHEEFTQAAPLKNWSAAQAQLYILRHGVPLHPLYELGFYRIGCWVCPALRSWEKEIMRRWSREVLPEDADPALLEAVLGNPTAGRQA